MLPCAQGAPWNKSGRVTQRLLSAQQWCCQRYNTTCCSDTVGEASWHQRWHTKGTVFPFTVVFTCQNGAFSFLSFFCCCCFMRPPPPPACWPSFQLCSTTETPGGSWKYGNGMRMCVALCFARARAEHVSTRLPLFFPFFWWTVDIIFAHSWDKKKCRTSRGLVFNLLTRFSMFARLLSSEQVGPHQKAKLEQALVK